MTPRELFFASHHQAAQVVTAMTLGCRVEYVDVAMPFGPSGCSLHNSATQDLETIFAAGFEMERVLGRMHDQAWLRCQKDRELMSESYSDRTGITIDEKTVTELFMRGAASSRAILEHATTRKAIDSLAEILSDMYGSPITRMMETDIQAITGLQSTVPIN